MDVGIYQTKICVFLNTLHLHSTLTYVLSFEPQKITVVQGHNSIVYGIESGQGLGLNSDFITYQLQDYR